MIEKEYIPLAKSIDELANIVERVVDDLDRYDFSKWSDEDLRRLFRHILKELSSREIDHVD